MPPHNDEGRPATNRTASDTTLAPIIADDDVHYRSRPTPVPDGPWQANFERMARRAAREPEFYEIAGRNIQALADTIRDGRWTA